MLIRDWISREVISVGEDTPIIRASNLMKEKNIRCLPVVDNKNRLIGIVTDRDLKEAFPSKATSLDVFELHYLLSKVTVGEIMTGDPIIVGEDETMEMAAAVMLENRISHLPALDDDGRVTGVVSQSDVFRVLIRIMGVYDDGVQFALRMEDAPGTLKEVADLIRAHDGRLVSVLQHYSEEGGGYREVYIRIKPLDKDRLAELSKALSERFELLYVVEGLREQIEKRIKRKRG